jgi:hypothetical protein
MKFPHTLLALALTLPLASAAHAQGGLPSPAPPPAVNARSYRLVWTLDESEGGKAVGTQHFEMVVTTGGRTTTKVGSKVPVLTGSYGKQGGDGLQSQFQYLDVGLNIDASLDDTGTGLRLRSKVEQSSVAAQPVTIANVQEPVIRQSVMEGTALLTPGKPITLGSLDVPGSTHHLNISVTLEQVK